MPPRLRAKNRLMMLRSTSSNFAGTSRTLVAVGTVRLASMLETILADTPRSGSGTTPVLTVAVAVTVDEADAAAVVGAAGARAGAGAGATGAEAAVTAGLCAPTELVGANTVAAGVTEACAAVGCVGSVAWAGCIGCAAAEGPVAALGVGASGAPPELAVEAELLDAPGASPLVAAAEVAAPFVAGPVAREEGVVAKAVLVCGFAP